MIGIIINSDCKSVEFDGLIFTKHANYFRTNRTKMSRGKHLILHRYIYGKYVDSDIDGFHIHHLDGNPQNNLVCNLIKLMPEQHREVHKHDLTLMHIDREEWQRRHDESGCQRKIICITTGKEYKSVREASRETGETVGQIGYSLEGRRKGIWKKNDRRLQWKDVS